MNKFKQYAVEYKLPNADKVVTNDPMEATYVGINMWKQAVEKAGTTDVDKVRDAMAGQTFAAPSGYTLKMDETNHHLHKPVMIGQIRGDGQIDVVYKTLKPSKQSLGVLISLNNFPYATCCFGSRFFLVLFLIDWFK